MIETRVVVSKDFFAGFTLAAYEEPSGKLVTHNGSATMPSWPEEITVEGITFGLEEVEFVGREDDPKGRFMNAQYC
jgi:hypothetical protein